MKVRVRFNVRITSISPAALPVLHCSATLVVGRVRVRVGLRVHFILRVRVRVTVRLRAVATFELTLLHRVVQLLQ